MKEKVFTKYPSLRNIDGVKFSKMSEEKLSQEYVATEKLHGTNSGITVFEDGTVDLSSRKLFIGFDSDNTMHSTFKDFVDIDYFTKKGLELIEKLGYSQITFFGELFGKGVYNMDYVQVKEGRKEFRVFDIIAYKGKVDKNIPDDVLTLKEFVKLDNNFVMDFLDKDVLVPFVAKGDLKSVIKQLDLDSPSAYGGGIEGYVIKPTKEITYTNDTNYALDGIKHKTTKFKEVIRKNKVVSDSTEPKHLKGLEGKILDLVEDMSGYVTLARLDNVISHGGLEVDKEHTVDLANALISDIDKEFEYDKDVYSEKDIKLSLKRITYLVFGVVNEKLRVESKKEMDNL